MRVSKYERENPIASKTWWTLGLASAGAALGLGVWAATRSSSKSTSPSAGTASPQLMAALQAVENMDSTSLCQSNSTVSSFQTLWNAGNMGSTLTVDGDYGPNTASAAQSLDVNAPAACPGMQAG